MARDVKRLIQPVGFIARPAVETSYPARPTWGGGDLPWRRPVDYRAGPREVYLGVKRVFDIVFALLALVLLAPLLLLIALAIRLEGPGPVLFRQERVGRQARRFILYKFRTMRPDRRARQASIGFDERRRSLKTAYDPRVTRVGRILRKACLDELPQLLNVLLGDMSLVGPRPEQCEMLKFYQSDDYRRHLALPGLTGWWQINARCSRGLWVDPADDLRQKLADDLYYIDHRSFWFDLRVMLLTIPVVVSRRGAL
jgi:lipopolysaccharide/colanic/teichoic acid biosynthesis glycosyltransferase